MRHACLSRGARFQDERGIAIIVVLMATSLLLALGMALTLTTMTETRVVANDQRGTEALYAADAAVEWATRELLQTPAWDGLLNGTETSSFVDGSTGGVRVLPGGGRFDLTEATNLLRCGMGACGDADVAAVSEDRPWGANNPVWRLYAFGPLSAMLPAGSIASPIYVVVWVGDDSSENDGDPLRDGGPPIGCNPDQDPGCADGNPGRDVIGVVAQAIGPDDTRQAVEVTLSRPRAESESRERSPGGIVSWRRSD